MLMKKLCKVSALAILAIGVVASCKKSSSSSTPSVHDNFVGRWKLHQVVNDSNANGVLDASDPKTIEDSFGFYLTLNGNGVGTAMSIFGAGTPFTWTLSANNSYLLVVDSGATLPVGQLIVTAPGSTFVIKDTADGSTNWETFVKQ